MERLTRSSRDNCVIADQERAVGIGGVMGGEETGVTDSTKNILLEAAYFLPASIRRTARDLNLPSDASYRFERGVDPDMILRASQRAAELMREIAGGTPAKEIHVAGELPADPADVSLSYEKCSRVIGVAIDPKTVDEILTRFGLRKTAGTRQVRNLEDSELPPRFAARRRSDRRSPSRVRNRQDSGKDARTLHANERG